MANETLGLRRFWMQSAMASGMPTPCNTAPWLQWAGREGARVPRTSTPVGFIIQVWKLRHVFQNGHRIQRPRGFWLTTVDQVLAKLHVQEVGAVGTQD